MSSDSVKKMKDVKNVASCSDFLLHFTRKTAYVFIKFVQQETHNVLFYSSFLISDVSILVNVVRLMQRHVCVNRFTF